MADLQLNVPDEQCLYTHSIISNKKLQVSDRKELVLLEYRRLGEGVRNKILHRKLPYCCIAMMNKLYKL